MIKIGWVIVVAHRFILKSLLEMFANQFCFIWKNDITFYDSWSSLVMTPLGIEGIEIEIEGIETLKMF